MPRPKARPCCRYGRRWAGIELNGTAIIDFHDTEEARSFAGIGAAVTQEAHNTMKQMKD
jgi:hypothetical protein